MTESRGGDHKAVEVPAPRRQVLAESVGQARRAGTAVDQEPAPRTRHQHGLALADVEHHRERR